MYLLILMFYFFDSSISIEHFVAFSSIVLVLEVVSFIRDLGEKVPILNILMIFVAVSWLFAPALTYFFVENNAIEKVRGMPINFKDYFRVAIPGTLGLMIGLKLTTLYEPKISFEFIVKNLESYLAKNTTSGKYLIGLGVISIILGPVVPSALSFVFYLSRNLIFIGVLYQVFTPGVNKWRWLILGIIFALVLAIRNGMFGDLIFWSTFFLLLIFILRPPSINTKISFFVIGIFSILVIQSVKQDLRDAIWWDRGNLKGKEATEVFTILIADRLSSTDELFETSNLLQMLNRMNQGYITAFAIQHTPQYEPFAKGETIANALLASLIPRFLWQDKPKAGGAENIKRFTGLETPPGVSYNIAPLGDAYVNFGIWGGAFFLFLYGLVFNLLFFRLLLSAMQHPSIILWIPLIFFAVVVAETDVITTFNHAIKTMIFMWLIFNFSKVFFKKYI